MDGGCYMNTIFLDFLDTKIGSKKERWIDSFLKIKLKKDFTNTLYQKNIGISIKESFFECVHLKGENAICAKFLKWYLIKEFQKTNSKIYLVFSKRFAKKKKYERWLKKYIKEILKDHLVVEITVQNEMLKHDKYYIDTFLKQKNIEIPKASILLVLNHLIDFKIDKVIEYIQKYKYVDILRLQDISKREYRSLLEKVNQINNEYGTTLEIIQRRNIVEYDVYICYSKIDIEEFKEHYLLNKEAKLIDITDEEQDTLSLSYRTFQKNKGELEAMLNRIDFLIEDFHKGKLGNLFLQKK